MKRALKRNSKRAASPKAQLLIGLILSFAAIILLAIFTKVSTVPSKTSQPVSSETNDKVKSITLVGSFHLPSNFSTEENSRFVNLTYDDGAIKLIAGLSPANSTTANDNEIVSVIWQENQTSHENNGEIIVWGMGEGNYNGSKYVMAVSTTNSFLIFNCAIYPTKKEFITCDQPHEFPELKSSKTFTISKKGTQVIVANSGNGKDYFTIISTSDSKKQIIDSPYQVGSEISALSEEGDFAFWSASEHRFSEKIGLYKNDTFSLIEDVPHEIAIADTTASIDYYGDIYLSPSDEVCFVWTVSGGSGIFVGRDGNFIQNPGGLNKCPARFK